MPLGALDHYDVAGAMEGYPHGAVGGTAAGELAERDGGGGRYELRYELNTGVLGMRRRSRRLCSMWLREFRAHAEAYASLSSADQPALMAALRAAVEFRFFPLPPHLNFREYTVYSHTGPAVPGIVHDLRLQLGPGMLQSVRAAVLARLNETLSTPWPEAVLG